MKFLSGPIFVFAICIQFGCVVQSTQIKALSDLFKEPDMDIHQNTWSVKYSDYDSFVYAVTIPEGILFSNGMGDQILFDGWSAQRIKGMGKHRLNIAISDANNVRSLKRSERVMALHFCDAWKSQINLRVTQYYQDCTAEQVYKNSILVDEQGNISMIRQIVDERYTALTLIKLK